MPSRPPVRIANGQGFWGDSILGPIRLLREGPLDYLTLDYLAEVTMSIMQKLKSRDPDKGYATDFVRLIDRVLPELVEKNVRVVANAGGVNPHACKDALMEVIAKHGLQGVKVAVVEGDDIFGDLDSLMDEGEAFTNMDTGQPLADVRDKVTSANVYLGAFPIAEALDQGAQIVVTGRGTDPGLVIGPMIHEFGWGPDDLDKLAAGTVAGHIVECGAQCTGGNFTDWEQVPDMAMIGYPIIEAQADGTFHVTKHAGTGGMVTRSTVVHQLAYEMGNPAAYLTPDVVADFTSFEITDEGLKVITPGKFTKMVEAVEHVTFAGRRARAEGRDVLYVTERCVMRLADAGLVATEIMPGIDPQRDIVAASEGRVQIAEDVTWMPLSLLPCSDG